MSELIRQRVNVVTIVPAAASFATPYQTGDVIGGTNTISNAVLDNESSSVLDSLVVLDAANQKSAIDLVFFDAAPVASYGADNSTYALNDSDLSKLIGRITVGGSDYVSSSTTNAEATLRNLGLVLQAAVGKTTLYCVVVCRGAPTYGSATDLSIKLALRAY